MELNYMWQPLPWTKRDGSGGSGITNVIHGCQLGTCFQIPYLTTLIRNLTFRVVSLSSGKQVQ